MKILLLETAIIRVINDYKFVEFSAKWKIANFKCISILNYKVNLKHFSNKELEFI